MTDETAGGSPAANATQGTDQRSQAASTQHDSGASGASTSPAAGDDIKNPEAKKYADEAAALRIQKKALEDELKQHRDEKKAAEDAKLTADEKRDRDLADLQAKTLDYEHRLQRKGLKLAGYELKDKLSIADIGAALALVETEHGGEVKYGADHTPTNLEDLLKDVLKAHPALVLAQQQQGSGPVRPTNVGAAMSPARSSVQPGAQTQPQSGQRFNIADPALWNRPQ